MTPPISSEVIREEGSTRMQFKHSVAQLAAATCAAAGASRFGRHQVTAVALNQEFGIFFARLWSSHTDASSAEEPPGCIYID